MLRISKQLFILSSVLFIQNFPKCHGIWPQPQQISKQLMSSPAFQLAPIPLNCGVNLALKSFSDQSVPFPTKPGCMINSAYNRAYNNFKSQIKSSNCSNNSRILVTIVVKKPAHYKVNPAQDSVTDEAYSITINAKGIILIQASSTIAALRSAWTLFQIPDAATGSITPNQYPTTILDEPEMIYRGVMVDTTRSISPTSGQRHSLMRLYELVDRMEIVKLNVLHWHLTDTDGLSFSFQNVTVTNPYLPLEIEALMEYAIDRGIVLIPEADVMGHTGRIWGEQTGISDFAPEDCPLQVNLGSDRAMSFILRLYEYIITALFKTSPIFGTGQDEVAPCGDDYVKDATSLQKRLHDMAKFNGNKTVMVWADTILEQGLSFDRDTLVLSWKVYEGYKNYEDGVISLLKQGYRTLTYPQNPWYIGRTTTAEGLYSYHPLDGVVTNENKMQDRGAVIGGAVSLWEPSIQDLKNQVFWPMTASVGEILWSKREFTKSQGFDRKRYNRIAKFIRNVPIRPVKSETCP